MALFLHLDRMDWRTGTRSRLSVVVGVLNCWSEGFLARIFDGLILIVVDDNIVHLISTCEPLICKLYETCPLRCKLCSYNNPHPAYTDDDMYQAWRGGQRRNIYLKWLLNDYQPPLNKRPYKNWFLYDYTLHYQLTYVFSYRFRSRSPVQHRHLQIFSCIVEWDRWSDPSVFALQVLFPFNKIIRGIVLVNLSCCSFFYS